MNPGDDQSSKPRLLPFYGAHIKKISGCISLKLRQSVAFKRITVYFYGQSVYKTSNVVHGLTVYTDNKKVHVNMKRTINPPGFLQVGKEYNYHFDFDIPDHLESSCMPIMIDEDTLVHTTYKIQSFLKKRKHITRPFTTTQGVMIETPMRAIAANKSRHELASDESLYLGLDIFKECWQRNEAIVLHLTVDNRDNAIKGVRLRILMNVCVKVNHKEVKKAILPSPFEMYTIPALQSKCHNVELKPVFDSHNIDANIIPHVKMHADKPLLNIEYYIEIRVEGITKEHGRVFYVPLNIGNVSNTKIIKEHQKSHMKRQKDNIDIKISNKQLKLDGPYTGEDDHSSSEEDDGKCRTSVSSSDDGATQMSSHCSSSDDISNPNSDFNISDMSDHISSSDDICKDDYEDPSDEESCASDAHVCSSVHSHSSTETESDTSVPVLSITTPRKVDINLSNLLDNSQINKTPGVRKSAELPHSPIIEEFSGVNSQVQSHNPIVSTHQLNKSPPLIPPPPVFNIQALSKTRTLKESQATLYLTPDSHQQGELPSNNINSRTESLDYLTIPKAGNECPPPPPSPLPGVSKEYNRQCLGTSDSEEVSDMDHYVSPPSSVNVLNNHLLRTNTRKSTM